MLTLKQLEQIKAQIPAQEQFSRVYSAYEGGLRVITVDSRGNEYRYEVNFDSEGNVSITLHP